MRSHACAAVSRHKPPSPRGMQESHTWNVASEARGPPRRGAKFPVPSINTSLKCRHVEHTASWLRRCPGVVAVAASSSTCIRAHQRSSTDPASSSCSTTRTTSHVGACRHPPMPPPFRTGGLAVRVCLPFPCAQAAPDLRNVNARYTPASWPFVRCAFVALASAPRVARPCACAPAHHAVNTHSAFGDVGGGPVPSVGGGGR